MERRIGYVRKFLTDKGFGFIKVYEQRDDDFPPRIDKSCPDVFLHIRECKNAGITEVIVGAVLEFDMTQTPKGFVASNVRLIQ
jgi:cold shock CspA family protein